MGDAKGRPFLAGLISVKRSNARKKVGSNHKALVKMALARDNSASICAKMSSDPSYEKRELDRLRKATAHLPQSTMEEKLMSLICPQCSQVNQEATVFCRTCGYRFQGNEQEVDAASTIRPGSLASLPANADPAETLKPGLPPVAQPTPFIATPLPQTPIASGTPPVYGQPAAQQQSPFFSQPAPSGPAQMYAPQQQQAPVYGQYPAQGGYGTPVAPPRPASPSALTTLQRGFAGKGTPVHHLSWLLEGKQVAPQTLNSAFIANLQKQNVLGVLTEHERLREHGTVLEERDYVKVRYGASSIFVYLAPMGQISMSRALQQSSSLIARSA